MTLGSLFDGSGGFPLAGLLVGITPVWLSEIEAYPLRVTAARFPDVKQLGDVTKINGAEIDPVDIITFGSPCQDLSVAGKQKGIHDGERSNLFFEAVRIIKEMRDADKANGRSGVDIRPRFAVWENVPGAFSSNKGADFQAVLQALASVSCDGVSIPRPKKWNNAGCVVGNGWSIAWRVYDAQYWGVPQRRKRIYLIADFASERAGEILFERESVCGNPAESGAAWEGTAADAEGCAGRGCAYGLGHEAITGGANRSGGMEIARDVQPCLLASGAGGVCINPVGTLRAGALMPTSLSNVYDARGNGDGKTVPDVCYAIQGNMVDRDTNQNGPGYMMDDCPTLNTVDKHAVCYPDTARALTARHDSSPCVDRGMNVVCYEGQNVCTDTERSFTLQAGRMDQQHIPSVVYDARGNGDGETVPTLTGDHQNRVTDYTALCAYYSQQRIGQYTQDCVSSTLMARDYKSASDLVTEGTEVTQKRKYIVRRLMPIECARLQGFPDWWTDGVEGSDSAQYKMWGNGIALPCAVDVLGRIAREGEHAHSGR